MKDQLLKRVLQFYSQSPDFNGLYVDGKDQATMLAAIDLIGDGMIQVVSEEDYPNPHIRPWPSKRSKEQQIASINVLTPESYGVCLYPTPTALRKYRPTKRHTGQPYRLELAKGRGTLELAYFSFDVLEQYRNDPRFTFEFYDFGANASISDEAYLDKDEPAHDKTGMQHIGFAYDLSKYKREDPQSPVIRRVCAFYGDLAGLSAVHQQRWKTYEVDAKGLQPHPVWWGEQMGHWADGPGPFEHLFFELRSMNELHERAFGKALFRTTDRPSDFGWILRPSQHEWDSFIHQLDKLLSENILHDGLDLPGVPRKDAEGRTIGTLNRLATLLTSRKISEDAVKKILKPLREIRQARQKPAHSLRKNITDKTFVHRQIALVEEVAGSLEALITFWQRHPKNKDWKPKYSEPEHGYRM